MHIFHYKRNQQWAVIKISSKESLLIMHDKQNKNKENKTT